MNIRIGNAWMGEVDAHNDPEFEQFIEIEYGLRAAFIILRRYIRRYGRNTIRKIVSAWAPSTENNTAAYIQVVASQVKIDPDTPIKYEDFNTMYKLVSAMCLVECGQKVDEAKIAKAYEMAKL